MLLPIDPTEGEEKLHLNTYQAITLLKQLDPDIFIPMHWGTWPYNEYGQDILGPINHLKKKLERHSDIEEKMEQLHSGQRISLVTSD